MSRIEDRNFSEMCFAYGLRIFGGYAILESRGENMKKADVFLSYEHSMRTVVEHICSVLEADGISC